ncbi:SRPBCC domain-containing protein [uncultured Tateyamaria sp.]|uniref:SRPBCC family protein n=1 Tax=uncultured Tateyamaria sp. TaxID=455651 RepID=UPI00261478AB|nr:SRPBCC domain-containing protein [uncultured Tateyamaria sp.]
MNKQNYRKSIVVTADATAAFNAVTHGVEHWWTRPDQPLRHPGDRAKFSFPPGVSYWTFELTHTDDPSRVEWTCVDALHVHEGQPKAIETEWLGTRVIWRISEGAAGTKIELEHDGLTPKLLCYDICEAGWDMFFLESLKKYLDRGQGAPHPS